MSLGLPKKTQPTNGENSATWIPPKPLPTIPEYGSYAIEVKNLTFSYNGSVTNDSEGAKGGVLNNLNLALPTGSRCLLIGANGSGKSTLMRILAGRHLSGGKMSSVRVLGLDAFHDTRLNFHRAYLDCDWGMRSVAFVGGSVPLMADIAVCRMMEKLQLSYPERREELIEMLGINPQWRMHQLSDGQRRRVQLFLGLLRPFRVLLLDEVTTSLDVCVRQDLLRWLHKESTERNATIIYATHIFDGLDDWANHLFYLTNTGSCGWEGPMDELDLYKELKASNSTPCKMLAIAERWLRQELDENRRLRIAERAQFGTDAVELYDPRSQGGYGSGRFQTDEELQKKAQRQGRLSDIMGNAGGMMKVHRTAGTVTSAPVPMETTASSTQ